MARDDTTYSFRYVIHAQVNGVQTNPAFLSGMAFLGIKLMPHMQKRRPRPLPAEMRKTRRTDVDGENARRFPSDVENRVSRQGRGADCLARIMGLCSGGHCL